MTTEQEWQEAWAQMPAPWPGELEQARVCWRKHRERVRWQFGRYRPCADCLDDLRQRLPAPA